MKKIKTWKTGFQLSEGFEVLSIDEKNESSP